jgi:hypothetical protein
VVCAEALCAPKAKRPESKQAAKLRGGKHFMKSLQW